MRAIALLAAILVSTQALAETKSVIVAPFAESNELQQLDWVSRSLHQALVDDVASIPEVTVLNASKPANPNDAQYIVRSTLQRGNGELRVSGRVEEVATGKTIGGFKAGGSERQLFAIQDSIAEQVQSILGGGTTAVAQQPQRPQTQPQPAQQPVMVAGGVFDGSDLQRALMDRDYIRRQSVRSSVPDYTYMAPTYGYQQPPYPYATGGYPSWYPYGGFGHFWGNYPSVIIIRKGHHGGFGGFHRGGSGIPSNNGQAIRHVASWAGRPPSHFVNVPGGTTASNITRPMPMTVGAQGAVGVVGGHGGRR